MRIKKATRALACLLSLLLFMGSVPFGAYAAGDGSQSFEVDAKFMNGEDESMAGTIKQATVSLEGDTLAVTLDMQSIEYTMMGATNEMFVIALEISDGNSNFIEADITKKDDEGFPLQYTFTLPEIAESTDILIGYSVPSYGDGWEHTGMSRQLYLDLSETGLVSDSTGNENTDTDEDAEDKTDEETLELAAGTYSVEVALRNAADTGLSMADGAISSTAQLVVDTNGSATLSVDFEPLISSDTTVHLTNMYLYDGATPATAKANVGTDSMTEVSYDNWYTEDGKSFPGTTIIPVPYMGTTGNLDRLYAQVAVDAMTNMGLPNQDAILVVNYSEIELQPLLVLSKDSVQLIAQDSDYGTDTVTARIANSDAYQITWSSQDTAVATVNNGIISAADTGETTILVKATADGLETLQKEIPVTVHAAGKIAITVSTTASSGVSTSTISGDVLVSSAQGISTSSTGVTIDAVSTATTTVTDASVTIEESALAGLAESDVSIATNVATTTFSKAASAQIATAGTVTLQLAQAEAPTSLGSFAAAYSFNLTDANSKSVSFDKGNAVMYIPGNQDTAYAYYYTGSALKEKIKLSIENDGVSFATTHFSNWALSAKDYLIASDGGTSTGSTSSSFLLDEDGNYYVDIALWKETIDEVSMGDVAFKNNRQALVTVKNGQITTVQVATNPINVGTYTSGITSFSVNGSDATVQETTSITTVPAGSTYDYLKRFSFILPSAAMPTVAYEATYVNVEFVVPDTLMDDAVGEVLPARLRFDWSSASATSATSLVGNSKTASSTSSITGSDIEDVSLTDSVTGIRLETTTDYISDKAKLSVTALTSGDDFNSAATALAEITDTFSLYKIVLTVDDVVTSPSGSVKLFFPSAGKELTIYRINDDGTKTKFTGTISGQYYVVSTSSLGLFAITEGELAEVQEDATFEDISDHRAKAYIEAVVARGLFNGTSETTFSPASSMTRGMFVTVLGRLAGVDANGNGETKFDDVSASAYYAPYVAWANENAIVNGTSDTTYTPDKAITRQEMAVMLYNYAVYAEISLNTGDAKNFADAASMASWATDAIDALSSAGKNPH